MFPDTARAILYGFLNWIFLSYLMGIAVSWVWMTWRLAQARPILPERPLVERRRTPWGGGSVFLAILSYLVVSYAMQVGYTFATRGHPFGYEPSAEAQVEKPADERTDGPGASSHPGARADGRTGRTKGAHGTLSLPEMMFVQAMINGSLIVLLPLLLRATSGARLRDLGLTFAGWRRQLAVGIVALLVLLPVVYGVQSACVRYLEVPSEKDRAHPVEKMLAEDSTGSVAYLAVIMAVVLAPALEELLFRGIIQSWLIRALHGLERRLRRRGPRSPLPERSPPSPGYWEDADATEKLAPLEPGPPLPSSWEDADATEKLAPPEPGPPLPSEEAPRRRVTKPSPRRPSSSLTMAAIVLTSILFALLHAPQWPAPIALFVLAVGMGYIYQRTGSLLTPICMHALFNGVSTVVMFLRLTGPPDANAPRPPVERVTPVEKIQREVKDVARPPLGGKL